MRGHDAIQTDIFSYISPEQRVPKNHPLRPIRILVNDALRALSEEFDKMYSNIGRPSIAPEKLVRALLLQILYTIRSERMLQNKTRVEIKRQQKGDVTYILCRSEGREEKDRAIREKQEDKRIADLTKLQQRVAKNHLKDETK